MTPEGLVYHGFLMVKTLDHHVGRENAIPVPKLAPLIGLGSNRDYRDVREVRDFLESEGYPVCADATGMWQADCPEEIEAVMASIKKTAMTLLWRYSRLRKIKRRLWPNWQPSLWREREAA